MGFSELIRCLLGIIFWNIYWARSCLGTKSNDQDEFLLSGHLESPLNPSFPEWWNSLTRGGQGVGGTGRVDKSHFLDKARRGKELKKKWESAQRRGAERQRARGGAHRESADRGRGVGVGHWAKPGWSRVQAAGECRGAWELGRGSHPRRSQVFTPRASKGSSDVWKTPLLRYNLNTSKFTHVMCVVLWVLVNLQSCAVTPAI